MMPRIWRIRQQLPEGTPVDVATATATGLAACSSHRQVQAALGPARAGDPTPARRAGRIAVAVGSRGIRDQARVVRDLVDWVRTNHGEPFLVPAMGSHGGATPEGQQRVLERLGITGAPVVSSMEVAELAPGVFLDRAAFRADGIVVVNRVKPHTSFHGPCESGLMKMIAVGLGKQAGASAIHRPGASGLAARIAAAARQVLATGRVVLGVALVEDAANRTVILEVVPGSQIAAREPGLLARARDLMARLPVDDIDVLIVDEIGKDISGTGMDTNVIGRLRVDGQPEPALPRVRQIVARDVRGANAYGIGLADVTTRRLVGRADWAATRTNGETSGFASRTVMPLVTDTDVQAIEWALQAALQPGGPPLAQDQLDAARIVRIANTSRLDVLLVSEAVRQELADRETVEVLGPVADLLAPM